MNLTIGRALKDFLKPELSSLNDQLETIAKSTPHFLGDLLKYVLIGSGKRIRPALVYVASELNPPKKESVRAVELAVEMIHIATLIHDDVIDNAAMRRGQKTVFHQHGVDAAVLLGDHIYTKAFQMAAELNIPLIMKLLSESTSVMCQGEIDQLENRYQFNLSEKDYFSFIHKKTASLFGVSARCGAILSNQSQEVQMALENYGVHLGIAFQITDDILDLTGDESVVGKTLRTDLMNGKMTLPLIHFRDAVASESEKNDLQSQMKNPNGHLLELIKKLRKAGSVDYAEKSVADHINSALLSISLLPSGVVKEQLTLLADLLRQRDS